VQRIYETSSSLWTDKGKALLEVEKGALEEAITTVKLRGSSCEDDDRSKAIVPTGICAGLRSTVGPRASGVKDQIEHSGHGSDKRHRRYGRDRREDRGGIWRECQARLRKSNNSAEKYRASL